MESWQEIQNEIAAAGARKGIPGDHDAVRREAYRRLSSLTGRPLIVYASVFHVPGKNELAAGTLLLDMSDKEAFQEAVRNIDGPAVDVWIHSPGGSAEAAESIVGILRTKFEDVRFIVTGSAKSAATMLAMSGNRILMSDAAELGPTDPQLSLGDSRTAPAGAILGQFDRAKKEIVKNTALIAPWLPILQQYGPSLLLECQNLLKLSEKLVAAWLEQYMFGGERTAQKKARKLARYLANDRNFLSHGRRVGLNDLRTHGAIVDRIEEMPLEQQEAIARVHLAIMATLDDTAAVKIFENSSGAVLLRLVQTRAATQRSPEDAMHGQP